MHWILHESAGINAFYKRGFPLSIRFVKQPPELNLEEFRSLPLKVVQADVDCQKRVPDSALSEARADLRQNSLRSKVDSVPIRTRPKSGTTERVCASGSVQFFRSFTLVVTNQRCNARTQIGHAPLKHLRSLLQDRSFVARCFASLQPEFAACQKSFLHTLSRCAVASASVSQATFPGPAFANRPDWGAISKELIG